MAHWTDKLIVLHACAGAVEWCRDFKTPQAAWNACERGNWMLWIAGMRAGKRGSVRHRKVVLAACECARLALKHVPKNEDRPRRAIETAEAWVKGETSLTEVREAAYAAYAAADAADVAYAADAAYAAYAAAYAAADAANVAAYAADAAYVAANVAARRSTLKECAVIVRRHIPKAPKL